jgi:predicted HAD superfamily Cof-like phosphohydrolase
MPSSTSICSGAARSLAEFRRVFAHPATDALWFRSTLHDEEHAELVEALESGDRAAIARELADVVYVAYGAAGAYGIDLDAALTAVHRANMAKAPGGVVRRRADGKLLKPDGWLAPDMGAAIKAGRDE